MQSERHVFKTILVPLDGSELSERALPYAEWLARAFDARLILHRAVPAGSATEEKGCTEPEALRQNRNYLMDVVNLALAADLRVDVDVKVGDPDATILQTIRDRSASVVVMSSHGREGLERMIRGSVADEILRNAPVPVLLAPRQAHIKWTDAPTAQIILPLDGSEAATRAIPYAAAMARALNGRIHLLRAVGYDPNLDLSPFLRDTTESARRYLSSVAQQLSRQGIVTSEEVREGRAVSTILRVVEEQDADLLVIGSHGRGGAARLLLGSVADSVLHLALVPVLVVRSAVAALVEYEGARFDDILRVRLAGRLAAA